MCSVNSYECWTAVGSYYHHYIVISSEPTLSSVPTAYQLLHELTEESVPRADRDSTFPAVHREKMLPADRWVSPIHSLTPFSSSSIFLDSFKPTQGSYCIVLCLALCEKQENFNCRSSVLPQWHQRGEPSWDCSHHTLPACLFIDYLLPLYFSLSHQWGSCVTWKLNGSLFPASEVIHFSLLWLFKKFHGKCSSKCKMNFFFFHPGACVRLEIGFLMFYFQLYYNQSTLRTVWFS